MLTPEALEEVEKVLEEIRELSLEGVPILVEGPRDEAALRELGAVGPIFRFTTKGAAISSLERLSRYRRVIVLTDFDRAGDELAEFCAKHLQRLGPRPLLEPRKKLKALVRRGVKDVQGLAGFLRQQQSALHRRF